MPETQKQAVSAEQSPKATQVESAQTPEVMANAPSHDKSFPIVGIGASAGGLEALQGFFDHFPADSNIAVVIIQHLSPKHKSIMGELLQKHTAMQVFEITDGMEILPNCVYLTPPEKHVCIINRTLQLLDQVRTRGVNLPIDVFFRSLAEDQGEKAICIILSGTGSDGTLGLKAIKGAGGMTIVQAENQARYDGMPHSAIDTGMVDFILPVEKIPVELMKYIQHPYLEGPAQIGLTTGQFENYAQKIFVLIRSHTGHDFSNYKQTTLRRRIERRLAVHQIDRLTDYIRYLQQTPAEIDILFKEMLIGVTNFFRDPEAFGVLAEKVLPEIFARKTPDMPIRLWVPGCATGEEAYSLAILLSEVVEHYKTHATVQIFASDLDADAIDVARLAVYPESIAADVSPERLQRFFIKEDNAYRVKKQIREMVVFAMQNLIKDPPFSRLDLVSCRNLLIYMDAVLQKRLLPLFHYTLLPQGILFLGSSESIGEFNDLFTPINTKWKIFVRRETGLLRTQEYTTMPFFERHKSPQNLHEQKASDGLDMRHLTERFALEHYTLPCVLLNEKYEMLYMIGPVDRYLKFTSGEPNFQILHAAREGLRYKLTNALQKAFKQQSSVTIEGIRVKQNGDFHTVDVTVRPLGEAGLPSGCMLVVFDEKPPVEKPVKPRKTRQVEEKIDPRIISLEQELQSTREYLQTTIEELETSNEELRSANEEMQSVNEELQSTNEELETSKEELQSTNEELVTVNTELQNKVEELSRANNDINNLLASTDIGVIFLNNNLRIKRFTPAMAKIFNLITSDVGRPISDITSNIHYDRLYQDAKQVLDTLNRQEMELQTSEGCWYSMHIAPYRTIENIIDGVVITFVDISAVKQAQIVQHNARIYAESIIATVRQPLLILDADLIVKSANTAFYRFFKMTREEIEHTRFDELGNRQWAQPELREVLEQVLSQNKQVTDCKVEYDFPHAGKKTIVLNARRIEQPGNQSAMILLAIEEVKEEKRV